MRGLFGGGGPETPGDAAIAQEAAAVAAAKKDDKPPEKENKDKSDRNDRDRERMRSATGFDPSGLERAAKAARELDRSPNAPAALALITEQERTKQEESKARGKEYEAAAKQMELERIQRMGEEKRKAMREQAEYNQQLENYKDRLDRKRQQDLLQNQIEAQRALQEDQRRKDEESVAKQEQLRKKTLEYEAALRQQTEIARVKAEAEGRIMQERQNKDIHRESAILQAKEYRDTVLESIKLATSSIGDGIRAFLGDKERMTAAATFVSVTALGLYSARALASVTGRFIESRIGKPPLVRETSRLTFSQLVRHPAKSLGLAQTLRSADAEKVMSGIVLPPALERRLGQIAVATQNARANGAPYRNLLFHGPPGTGKTLFAKSLARNVGMHYAIMTGGDIAPLGREAVSELHKVFDWANTSKRGLLLFIDEADAFLRSRTHESMSEDLRSALNAFLYRTGEASHRFMVVYASNEPELFDWAATDRVDEVIEFELPTADECKRLVELYFNKYIRNVDPGVKKIQFSGISDSDLDEVAKRVVDAHFSGRDISKMFIGLQSVSYGSKGAILTKEALTEVVDLAIHQKHMKAAWLNPSAMFTDVQETETGHKTQSQQNQIKRRFAGA